MELSRGFPSKGSRTCRDSMTMMPKRAGQGGRSYTGVVPSEISISRLIIRLAELMVLDFPGM